MSDFSGIVPGPVGEPSPRRREALRAAGARTLRTVEYGQEDAPVALMLHGLPGSAEDWDRLGTALAPAFRAIAIDRPGYGGSGRQALRVPEQVDRYIELLETLGAGPALLLGHSYGALPAAALAARRPDLVGGLVLLAPALREHRSDRDPPPGTDAIKRLLAKPAIAAFIRGTILSEAGRSFIARVADPMSFAPDPVDEDHLAGVRDRTLQWDALRSFMFEAKALRVDSEAVDRVLGILPVPSIVIHARGDRVVEPAAGRRTAQSIPRCGLHEIDGGHMLTVSRVDEIVPLIHDLARRAGLGSAPPPEEH